MEIQYDQYKKMKKRDHEKIKMLLILGLFPVFIIITQLYYSHQSISARYIARTILSENIKMTKWDMIRNIIEENEKIAKLRAQRARDNIFNKLTKNYKDLEELREDLELNHTSSMAFDIFFQEIEGNFMNVDNFNNRIFIANSEGIIADRGIYKKPRNNRKWTTEIALNPNPELASKSLQMILTKNGHIIFWHCQDPEDPDSVNVNLIDVSLQALRSEYESKGLKILKNYNILIPAYITDNGDIFGVLDIDSENKLAQNYKIIVIQEFNIYDAILMHMNDIEQFDRHDEQLTYLIDSSIDNDMISLTIIIILTFLAFCSMIYGANLLADWGEEDGISKDKGSS